MTDRPTGPATAAGKALIEWAHNAFPEQENIWREHAALIEAQQKARILAALPEALRDALPAAVNFRVPLALPVRAPQWDEMAAALAAAIEKLVG